MKYQYTNAEKIAPTTAFAGALIVVSMPFFSVPFHVPYPSWTLTPMEHAIYLFFVSILVLIVGAPASIIAIRQKRQKLGWISLIGSVFTYPLGIAAYLFVAFLFGENINFF